MLAFALLLASAASDAAPNIWGETGVVQVTSARAPGNLRFDVGAQGFLLYVPDYVVAGADENVLAGAQLTASAALLDVLELSLASRSASNVNTARGPAAFTVGDLYPSLKLGFAFLPVAVGVDTRLRLPTRVDAAGLDFDNVSVATTALFTLDLHDAAPAAALPLRAHLNAGYIFEGGKYSQGEDGAFEDNPNFYDGVDGALLALATDGWFYDSVTAGLAVEAPLPYVTPFLEVFYRTAVGVPADRGAGGAAYDVVNDAHLTITPGARVTALDGLTFDVAVDLGVLGTGNNDAAKLVQGTPPNAPYLLRFGVTSTFDPFAPASTAGSIVSAGPSGQIKGCVVDANGRPVPSAVVEGPALGGARLATDENGCFVTPPLAVGAVQLTVSRAGYESAEVSASVEDGKMAEVSAALGGAGLPNGAAASGPARVAGYVTNKEDETLDADVEIWDATSPSAPKSAGKAQNGAFDVAVQSGDVAIVARADGYVADGVGLRTVAGERAHAAIVLKKVPKKRLASLDKERINVTTKVPFEFKKPRLQSTAEYVLGDVIDVLLRNPAVKVRVEVHAEALASPEESQRLADERAAAVVDYLVQHGVWRARLEAKGIPLAPADGDKARRVEFVVVP